MENINLKTKIFQQDLEGYINNSDLPAAIKLLVLQGYVSQLNQQFTIQVMEENEAMKKEEEEKEN